MTAHTTPNRTREAGFIMVEMLAAVLLMVVILTALATVTAQWMPNWNRGMTQVQQMERLGIGLDRIVSDLGSAQFVPIAGKALAFDGSSVSVTFVRTAIGPAARPGLEFVRLTQRSEGQSSVLVRERSSFDPAATLSALRFGDPVTLIRSPYRIGFSYADARQAWRPDWHDAVELPKFVRITVREALTDRVIVASTTALVPVDVSSECVRQTNLDQCLAGQKPRLSQSEL